MVAAWLLVVLYPASIFGTSASERVSARLERPRNVAHCAVGRMGRPASVIKRGEFVNFELTANDLMILVAQTSVCALLVWVFPERRTQIKPAQTEVRATHCRHENYCIGALKLAGSGDSGGNIVTLTRESPGFTGTTGPPGQPISRVR